MLKHLYFLALALLLCTSGRAQNIHSEQRSFRDAYVATERLPDGRQLHLLDRESVNEQRASTLILLSEIGDTLWTFRTDEAEFSRISLTGLILETDNTVLVYGWQDGCDYYRGLLLRIDLRDGRLLRSSLERFDLYIRDPNAGVLLSSGNILLVSSNQYLVLRRDFSELLSWDSRFSGCNFATSLLPGGADNFAITTGEDDGCGRRTYQLRIDESMEEPTMAVVGQLYEDAPFADYATLGEATYTYAGGQLLKLNQRLDVVATSPQSPSLLVGEFLTAGDDFIGVALEETAGRRSIIRFETASLLPRDTTSVPALPGLVWQDFLWANDSFRLFGYYDDPETEGFRRAFPSGTSGVQLTLAPGTAFRFPNLDAELSLFIGLATTRPVIGSCNGPGCDGDAYHAAYDSLRLTVTNLGTETINGFYLQNREWLDCQCSFCDEVTTFRQRFDGLNLAPGERTELTVNPIYIPFQIGRSQLCLWLTSLNDAVDVDWENNIICLDRLSATEIAPRLSAIRVMPNRAAGTLTLSADQAGPFSVTLFDLQGRRVATASGLSAATIPMPSQRGVYLARLNDERGGSRTVKVAW
jgi:hypothetical protein